jgi:hypothetical protein
LLSIAVMRHPQSGSVEVWWSPCPSRECPEDEEINIVLDSCIDHCLLLELDEQNPKIESIPQQSTKSPAVRGNTNEEDDLNFKISKKKNSNQTQLKVLSEATTDASSMSSSENPFKYLNKSSVNLTDFDMDNMEELEVVEEESEEERFVLLSLKGVFLRI